MKLSANKNLYQFIALVFLFTSFLIQVRTVFACELMAASVQTDHCCQEHATEECATSKADPCIASIDNVQPADAFIVKSLESVSFLPSLPLSGLLSQTATPRFYPATISSWSAGSDIYLKTQRFRE